MAGAARHSPARAVTGNGAVDECRVDGGQRIIAELDAVEDPRPKALHQDVRIQDSAAERLVPALGPQVDRHDLLAVM